MHELSIAQSVIEQVEQTARKEKAARVVTITLVIGALSGVEREALEFAFPLAAEKTRAAKAKLIIKEVPAQLTCRACRAKTDFKTTTVACPKCGSTDVEVSGGRDLIIQSIELET